jgi:hypothetical protein
MDKKEINRTKNNGVASILRTVAFGTALSATLLGVGCSKGNDKPTEKVQTEIHRTVSVPVCEYTIQRRDGIEKLFKSQMGRGFYQRENVTTSDRFIMSGGDSNNQNVQFSFNMYDVLRLVNNAGDDYKILWYYSHLKHGRNILMPNLKRSGDIEGQPCKKVGDLVFDATYDRETRKDKKSLTFNGKTISVK